MASDGAAAFNVCSKLGATVAHTTGCSQREREHERERAYTLFIALFQREHLVHKELWFEYFFFVVATALWLN